MAPEYIHRGKFTKGTYIYSLGVMIMEIVAGGKKYPEDDPLQFNEAVRLHNWSLVWWINHFTLCVFYFTLSINAIIGTCIMEEKVGGNIEKGKIRTSRKMHRNSAEVHLGRSGEKTRHKPNNQDSWYKWRYESASSWNWGAPVSLFLFPCLLLCICFVLFILFSLCFPKIEHRRITAPIELHLKTR